MKLFYLIYIPTVIFLLSLLLLFSLPISLIVILAILFFSPIFIFKLKEYLEEEELEYNFPIFLRDLAQYLEIGQPLPIALKSVKENNYGKKLNYEIRKMFSEMEFGLTFIETLERMARRVKSDKVKKTIYSIIEAEKVGGDIKGLLENLARSLQDLMNIKRERISRLKNFMLVYYGIYFGLLISITLIKFFVSYFFIDPKQKIALMKFKQVAFILCLLNAIFTGLVVGKMSTGKVIAGITHSIILLSITSLVFLII